MKETENNEELVQFSFNKSGGYFVYRLLVQRGIKGKTKSKVNELLIVGIPFKQMEKYCEEHEYIITSKALYQYDMKNKLLTRTGVNVWEKK